jgi:hypothetical protein
MDMWGERRRGILFLVSTYKEQTVLNAVSDSNKRNFQIISYTIPVLSISVAGHKVKRLPLHKHMYTDIIIQHV